MQEIASNLYVFDDTCNVYVLRDGDRAILIDCGSGAIVDQLPQIGVEQVDWVLFTHHHRDQCFGASRLLQQGASLAAPQYERHLFDRAHDYWQQKRIFDNYNDRSTFFTIGEDLPVARALEDYERFEWGPYSLFILPTPGHTHGSVTLIVTLNGRTVAFTGDLMHDDGKLYQLHAMEYEYGDLIGATLTAQSITALRKKDVSLALPSHGPIIESPNDCIDRLDERLHALLDLMRDRVGAPPGNRFPHEIQLEEITPHLLWGTEHTCSNFYVIKSDSGKALFIDYPYFSRGIFLTSLHSPEPFAQLRFTEHHLDELCERWGIRKFDVVIATHIHDDHVCGIPYLQKHYDTKCWTLEDVAKVIEAPERWNTPCIMQPPVRVDRRFQDGERFEWEGIPFEIVFYPGQTEFHAAIAADIDGRRVLFSGDSSYPLKRYLPEKKKEWMVNSVLRNSLTFAMHRKCADEFERLHPDLLCPGHGPYYEIPEEAFKSHREYVECKEAVWRDLLPAPEELGVDLFWARLLPYQSRVGPGSEVEYTLQLRNSFDKEATFSAHLTSALPASVHPEQAQVTLAPGARGELTFRAHIPENAPSHSHCRHLVTAHVVVDGRSYGPITEALLVVSD